MAIGLQRLSREDLVESLFNREDSRRAARAFLEWMKGKGGRCTKSEMSQFAQLLADGKLGARLSRQNFYRTILARFKELELVTEHFEYDQVRHAPLAGYRALYQPLSGRRPPAPSLISLAYDVGARWNQEFGYGVSKSASK